MRYLFSECYLTINKNACLLLDFFPRSISYWGWNLYLFDKVQEKLEHMKNCIFLKIRLEQKSLNLCHCYIHIHTTQQQFLLNSIFNILATTSVVKNFVFTSLCPVIITGMSELDVTNCLRIQLSHLLKMQYVIFTYNSGKSQNLLWRDRKSVV